MYLWMLYNIRAICRCGNIAFWLVSEILSQTFLNLAMQDSPPAAVIKNGLKTMPVCNVSSLNANGMLAVQHINVFIAYSREVSLCRANIKGTLDKYNIIPPTFS